jgi:hypothetical protein
MDVNVPIVERLVMNNIIGMVVDVPCAEKSETNNTIGTMIVKNVLFAEKNGRIIMIGQKIALNAPNVQQHV